MAIEIFTDGDPSTPTPTPGTTLTAAFLNPVAEIKDAFENTVNAVKFNNGVLSAATLNEAITAIGSAAQNLFIRAGSWTIGANVTVPDNIAVEVEVGALINVLEGFTLTINRIGRFPNKQIFTGSGTVILPLAASPYELSVWRGGNTEVLYKWKFIAHANASGKGIAVWRGAGPGDTTEPNPGEEGPGWFNQTCVGLESGESFTTGNDNTSLGYRTLKNATSALDCTAVGADCMRDMVDGLANTAIGWRAMMLMTGGSSNTALGNRAMGEAPGGDDNVAVGGRALFKNETNGIRNVAVGKQTLELNTVGNNNVAVGYLSQQASTTQNRNTSIGSRTLEFLQADAENEEIGADNTAVGWSALQSITTGHTNTAIGLQAGRRLVAGGGAVAQTVINSCYIGANTDASANDVENENVFGFGADGMGSNTVSIGNEAITDTYLRGMVRAIGVSGGGRFYASTESEPGYYLDESDQPENGRRWFMRSTGGTFQISTQNDEENDGNHAIAITRTGIDLGAITLGCELRLHADNTVSSSSLNTVTHKIKLRVDGSDYFVLASTSDS